MKSLVLAFALSLTAATAAEPELRDLLRDGLYAEEVTRDAEAAARDYEKILARAEADQPFIANALFRLAELRRKQDRKEEAIKLYQRLLTRYPETDPQAKLSREALTLLGIKDSATPATASEEQAEVMRLKKLAATNPDLLKPLELIPGNAAKGWGEVTRFLIERLDEARRHEGLDTALAEAAASGQLALCRSLISDGANVNGMPQGATLRGAVWNERMEVVKLLLSKGANPNQMPAFCRFNRDTDTGNEFDFGGALHVAAAKGSIPLIEILLASEADASLVAPGSSYTPLHSFLAGPVGNNLKILKALLDHGAKPGVADPSSPNAGIKTTALVLGLRHGVPVIKMLLEAGAKPEGAFELDACQDVAIAKLLLDHGADAKLMKTGSSSRLQSMAKFGRTELVRLLLEHGAPVSDGWKLAGFAEAAEPIRTELIRRFYFPEWSAEGKIRILIYRAETPPGPRTLAGTSINDFAPVLTDLEKGGSLAGALFHLATLDSRALANGLILHRKNASGEYASTTIPLTLPDLYPTLQPGDILQVTYAPEVNEIGFSGGKWTNEVQAALLQHVAIPITVEFDGLTQPLTLRGNCVVYDPTLPVAPWLGGGDLVNLLSPGPSGTQIKFKVYRMGWSKPFELMNWEDRDFVLQEGDRVVIGNADYRQKDRKSITLVSPGLWFVERFSSEKSDYAESRSSPPSLLQAIAEIYAGYDGGRTFAYPAELPWFFRNGYRWKILRHPDFSNIRIRRVDAEGKEKVIAVDLEKAAVACKPDAPPQEARKADMELLPGDVVELPVLANKKGVPWTGFSETMGRLFSKALSGEVEIRVDKTSTLRALNYVPARFVDTPSGLMPVANTTGVSTLRASRLVGLFKLSMPRGLSSSVTLKRGDSTSEKRSNLIFLRDGDQVEFKENSR